jgi:hypothetical protein
MVPRLSMRKLFVLAKMEFLIFELLHDRINDHIANKNRCALPVRPGSLLAQDQKSKGACCNSR